MTSEPDVPPGDAERVEQFLIVVGDICTGAALAGLEVCVRTVAGQLITGHAGFPDQVAPGVPEVDDTGYGPWLTVGGHRLRLTDVVACEVRAPGPDPGESTAPPDDSC